jgi:hypothetical protein
MRNDLERMFQVKVSVKEEIIPTCVLTLKKGRSFVKPENDSTYIDLRPNHLKAHDVNVIRLYEYLNEHIKENKNAKPHDPPFVDETGIKSNIDIDIDLGKQKPGYLEIKNLIRDKYGIEYEIKKHKYPITIIKDLAP